MQISNERCVAPATEEAELPLVLAGPLLRRVQNSEVVWWLISREPLEFRLLAMGQTWAVETQALPLAKRAFAHLLKATLPLPEMTWTSYDLQCRRVAKAEHTAAWLSVAAILPHLLLPGENSLGLIYKPRLDVILHGSCRKPHFEGPDGLLQVDEFLVRHRETPKHWPSALIFTGDQIYTDDVAGPMLRAIHACVKLLKFPEEQLPGLGHLDLHGADARFYQREQLLPTSTDHQSVISVLFKGARKPVFTSGNAQNHLMSLAEVLGMYLLVWSPMMWRVVGDAWKLHATGLAAKHQAQWDKESKSIAQFVLGLDRVARALAHVPVAMIFDDHDITDDWNLSADWEQTAYGHPLSKRIIGNAVLGYAVCQAWGNNPEQFSDSLLDELHHAMLNPGSAAHDLTLHKLIDYDHWNYSWSTTPKLLVLDTRTQRWWSEGSPHHPSGLMDWEALIEMQMNLLGHQQVVMVSPAPIFGVKLIEVVQRVFTWLGKPLLVDAENWMANRSTATTLLNMFRHRQTPRHFLILSGDVHYSFAYHIRIRSGLSRLWRRLSSRRLGETRRAPRNEPDVWQVTSSGLSNEFPPRLLAWFDRLNEWLYQPMSPLNWLTKRRRLFIRAARPEGAERGRRLLNKAGVGLVVLDASGRPTHIAQLGADGQRVDFELHTR